MFNTYSAHKSQTTFNMDHTVAASTPENDDLIALDRWLEAFEHDAKQKLNIWYQYSPEWLELNRSHWNSYDEIVRDQVRAGLPRRAWQDEVEKERMETSVWKTRTYKPMPDHQWKICPLSIHFDRYLVRESQDRDYGWKSALQNWDHLCSFLKKPTSNQEVVSNFMKSLSNSQRSSLKVLDEWWSSSYCNPELPAAVRSYINSRTENCTTSLFTNEAISDALPALISSSLYHSQCYRLFLREFHPNVWEPFTADLSLQTLQRDRYEAAIEASIQRLAYSVLHPHAVSITSSTPYPAAIMNEHSWNSPSPSAPGPRFLWDNRARRTIDASALQPRPPYLCISHTWGRWRKPSSASIPGVDWPVPENTRYDVRALPDELSHVESQFIWFDLFCIPQNGSPLADIEIANQSSIFKGATETIAWVNDVESWPIVQHHLNWLGLKYLKIATNLDTDTIDEKLTHITQLLETSPQVELMKKVFRREEGRSTPKGEPVSWFSSLWTLQECVLCPDITLFSRNWDALTDNCGARIDLRTLVLFISQTRSLACLDSRPEISVTSPHQYRAAVMASNERRELLKAWNPPNGVRDLIDLSMFTRLADVLGSLSPVTVFTNANVRECSGDRAPAIMSAIGVTDWYLPWSSNRHEQTRKHLVLGIYPLEFIQEAARKFGAVFFETSSSKESFRVSALDFLFKKRPIGSMLPFSRETGWDHNIAVANMNTKIDIRDHEAVSRWAVRADGAVEVPAAGIIAASSESTDKPTPAVIEWWEGPVTRRYLGGDIVEVSDFSEKLKEIARKHHVYAVALYEDCGRQYGVLLQSPRMKLSRQRRLMKIGRYILVGVDMPPSRLVNWLVL